MGIGIEKFKKKITILIHNKLRISLFNRSFSLKNIYLTNINIKN
jgi:hypothetical protein